MTKTCQSLGHYVMMTFKKRMTSTQMVGTTLWCKGRSGDKQTNVRQKRDREETSTRRQEREEEEEEVEEMLREKYASTGKYSTPQLHLWSRMIASSQHKSLEEPPNIPPFWWQHSKED